MKEIKSLDMFFYFGNANELYEWARELPGHKPYCASRQGDCIAIIAPDELSTEQLPKRGMGYAALPWEKPENVLWWDDDHKYRPNGENGSNN